MSYPGPATITLNTTDLPAVEALRGLRARVVIAGRVIGTVLVTDVTSGDPGEVLVTFAMPVRTVHAVFDTEGST